MDGGGCRQQAARAGTSGLACLRVVAASLATVKRGEAVA
jgi:hypothetical protein